VLGTSSPLAFLRRTALLSGAAALLALLGACIHAQDFLWTEDDADAPTAGYQYTAGSWLGGGTYVTTTTGSSGAPVLVSTTRHSGANAVYYDYKLSKAQGVDIACDIFHSTPGTKVDITQYTYLCFWVLGTQVGQLMRVALGSGPNATDFSARLVLTPYVDDGGTGEGVSSTIWRGVNVPIAALMSGAGSTFSATQVGRVSFGLLRTEIPSSQQGTLYIDHVYFSHGVLPVRAANLCSDRTPEGVLLTWDDPQPQTNLGFRVYRLQESAKRIAVDETPIAIDGVHYSVMDRDADPRRACRYEVVAIGLDNTEWMGDSIRVPAVRR
jgi:hypothetical protein